MRDFIKSWGATVGAIVVIVGAFISTMAWIGWPPYAAKVDFETLTQQVQANTEASLLQQLENAIRRNDHSAIRRLCNVVQKLYGYKPAGCP